VYIIKEKIYGNMATVFHRTSVSDLVNKVYTEGFKPGDGAMYGEGFYATYELESQQKENMKTYGNIIVKFAVPIENFLIFDYSEFIKSPNFKKLGHPSIKDFLPLQFNLFKIKGTENDGFSAIAKIVYTSDIAHSYVKSIPNFTKLCQGIIFTGRNDGRVLVAYDTTILMPLSYSMDDGKTFESVEKNREYLKKVSVIKMAKFELNPKIKPEDFGIASYDFTKDGFLDVFGSVNLDSAGLTKIPFKFGHVHGHFNCSSNFLTSLKGSPRIVEGDFECSNNKLTSLEYGPETVEGYYSCYSNNLQSLAGSPKEVGGSFYCNQNQLTTLQGGPKIVGDSFDCSMNKLTDLIGSPKEVSHSFYCMYNKLTTLDGSPKIINDNFICSTNHLTTLEGGPQKVDKNYDCNNNNLVSLLGAPSSISGLFNCESNELTSLEHCPKAKGIGYRNNPGNFSKEEIEKYLIH
jgi:hypothetical protein